MDKSEEQAVVVRIRRGAGSPTRPVKREVESLGKMRTLEFSSLTLDHSLKNSTYDISQGFVNGLNFRHDETQAVSIKSSIHRAQDDPLSLFLEIDSMNAGWLCLEMDLNVSAVMRSDYAFLNMAASCFPSRRFASMLKLISIASVESDYQINKFSLGSQLRSTSASFSHFAQAASQRGEIVAARILVLLPLGSYIMRLQKLTYGPI